MYYLNNNLKDLVRIFDQNERKKYLRLDLNENPGGLPQDFINSILPEITPQLIAQYPETHHFFGSPCKTSEYYTRTPLPCKRIR